MTSIALPQIPSTDASVRYQAYAYAYPHKTAYRPLNPPILLKQAWSKESRDSLFLYVHLPFCEMRCGFCNLFTLAQPVEELVSAYLCTLQKECRAAGEAVGKATFTQLAVGGGTPTFLSTAQLESLFDMLAVEFSIPFGEVPLSVETSPRTASIEKMLLLKRRGVTRVSMGVQSFVESEVKSCGRAQTNKLVERAIQNIRAADFPIMNLDLIYGLPGQSVESWLSSVRMAISHQPQELYLYPLYVRPLTGLARRDHGQDDPRVICYEQARELLLSQGYDQVSMRMFRKLNRPAIDGPLYCCQDDGMLGLGCGARSYTRELHYSREFAVGRDGVKAILRNYIARDLEAFRSVDYGCQLDESEQKRRFVIKSILRTDGFSLEDYQMRFLTRAMDDFLQLRELMAGGYLEETSGALRPTRQGLDFSDMIGPMLFSENMRRSMGEFDLR